MKKVKPDVLRTLIRKNKIKEAFFNFFLDLASFPRMLLEVFLRKNFGERYLNMASVITVAIILYCLPFLIDGSIFPGRRHKVDDGSFTIWYAFTAVWFVIASWRVWQFDKSKSAFNFGMFTYYSGDTHPLFQKFTFFGKPDRRTIDTVYEPLFFFVAGIIIRLVDTKLGNLICISSIMYSFSYVGAYMKGDQFLLDKIDEIIWGEQFEKIFTEETDPEHCKGVYLYSRRPESKQAAEMIAKSLLEEEAVPVS